MYRLINEDMDNRIAKLKIDTANEEDGVKEEITQIEHDCVSVLILKKISKILNVNEMSLLKKFDKFENCRTILSSEKLTLKGVGRGWQ